MKKRWYLTSILCLLTFGSIGSSLSVFAASSEGKTQSGVTFVEGTPNKPDEPNQPGSSGTNTKTPTTPSQGSATGKSYLPKTGSTNESNLIIFGFSLLVLTLGWLYWNYRNKNNSVRN